MILKIPYYKGSLRIEIADNRLKCVLKPKVVSKILFNQSQVVKNALENSIASKNLKEMTANLGKILIITSDHTRPVPSKITLPLLLKEIETGNPNVQIKILIATGNHRASTVKEMADKYGEEIIENYEVINHNSSESDKMVYKGILPSGGELWVNILIDWADLIVAEGFIEPHFFAGFSGGRKSILPGICSKETIMYNHNAQFVAHKNARTGILKDNPIHKDMIFAAKAAGLSYVLNVVLNENKEVIAAFAGDPVEAHQKGCEIVANIASIEKETADIVVVSNGGYPLDQNIYQTVKGMTAAESCINKGGVMIMISSCVDGHGGESFFKNHNFLEEILNVIESTAPEDTAADQWEAQILARVLKKCSKVILVSRHIDKKTVNDMHMEHAETFEEALYLTDEILGYKAEVVVIPDGVGVIVK